MVSSVFAILAIARAYAHAKSRLDAGGQVGPVNPVRDWFACSPLNISTLCIPCRFPVPSAANVSDLSLFARSARSHEAVCSRRGNIVAHDSVEEVRADRLGAFARRSSRS